MSKDRFKDFQKSGTWTRSSYRRLSRQLRSPDGQTPDGQTTFVDNNNPLTLIDVDDDHQHDLKEFSAQINLTRLLIDQIDELAKDVEKIHLKMLEPLADPKLEEELSKKTSDIRKLAYDLSAKLKKFDLAQHNQKGLEKGSASWRIKHSQILTITRYFRDVMDKYNQESLRHRDRCTRAIVRELDITGIHKTTEELEEILESGSLRTFTAVIDLEKVRQEAAEIQARHRDITQLEKALAELRDMFSDLALLISKQGDMIDNIEIQVHKAEGYVEVAKEKTKETVEIHNDTRRKKVYICIIIIVIVVVLLFIIASYLAIQKKITGR